MLHKRIAGTVADIITLMQHPFEESPEAVRTTLRDFIRTDFIRISYAVSNIDHLGNHSELILLSDIIAFIDLYEGDGLDMPLLMDQHGADDQKAEIFHKRSESIFKELLHDHPLIPLTPAIPDSILFAMKYDDENQTDTTSRLKKKFLSIISDITMHGGQVEDQENDILSQYQALFAS